MEHSIYGVGRVLALVLLSVTFVFHISVGLVRSRLSARALFIVEIGGRGAALLIEWVYRDQVRSDAGQIVLSFCVHESVLVLSCSGLFFLVHFRLPRCV